ncbi:hypothetical protein RH831_10715 [Halodesulfurarchaeum sp. HSR-GB]|uniref:hypothetical protein n=1 Tax=Halodesulfurarchaeum sp. HSR-GB TaxID=3074077 RepID=UPI0028599877|nr:hypothetical protein [Halodesulfurarchaeum sp. HSR-GB]MDR5657647.1 hypothetical protein [Halodesulfurarchaeum sp. HSR-GB]
MEGVNAKICVPCGHNLHIHNPDVLHVIGAENTFQIWVYYPPINTWGHDSYPVFIDAKYDATGSIPHGKNIDFQDLSRVEKDVVKAKANGEDIGSLEGFSSIENGAIREDLANAVTPFKRPISTPDESAIAHVASRIPEPTVFTAESIYTKDESEIRDIFRESTSGSTSQSTLV